MIVQEGKKRVIITNVAPQVNAGSYPAKSAQGETVFISADIFSDGHDEIAASAFIRPQNGQWLELPMHFVINDYWAVPYITEQTGLLEFKIEAWVDHFNTWSKGLQKKQADGQDIAVELLIGVEMLEAALKVKRKDNKQLRACIKLFKDPAKSAEAVVTATSNELSAIMYGYRSAELVTAYTDILKIEVERKRAAYSSWYELFPRSASAEVAHHGTFKDVIRLLPRVAGMGFDVLYFPPIHPIGEKNRKGRNNSLTPAPEDPGSPWAIGNRTGGHKAIHPQLGTLEDFKSLVATAKQHDIEIAIDIAFQCAPDHPYVLEHPEWFKWRPDGTVQYAENPPKKYEDILPFDFENDNWEGLWRELKSVVDYWITAGVTIFRIDNPHTKAFRFWEWMIAEVRKVHPEVLFLAEAFTRPRLMERLGKAGFTQSYTYYTWRNTKKEIEEYMTQLTKTDMRYYFRPNFWPNTPDILPPELVNGGENAHIIRLILAATLSSNYGLYGPVYEFGINKPHGSKEEYVDNEKYEIKHWDWWSYTRIGEVITRVNRIRRANPALHTTWNIDFADTSNDQLICFTKADDKTGNHIIVAVNLDPHHTQGAHIKIPFEKLGLNAPESYWVSDLLSGERYEWHNQWNYVQLNPYQMPAHIFKVEQR